MKYSELISFEAIESVLKLKDADNKVRAKEHVQTFVMSPNLRKQLSGVVFKELQFIRPTGDSKGVFIVGNYGTGKTHLMSVVSTVCEYDDILPNAEGDEKLIEAIKLCQGNFKVVRITIGATLRNLREIICDGLTTGLKPMGIEHKFPSQKDINDHEATFQELMAKIDEKFPGKGLLLVVDELLDYLRQQDEQQLFADLTFLREIGEISKNTRFRFMAGIQESLFDNPSWNHVSEAVRRVRDRFAQIRIQREDVATVVSRRLLQKTPEQKKIIRAYLDDFTPLYPILTDRMTEFVELFPVHPVFLEKFEKIHVAERREVLKTISSKMKDLLDEDVPLDCPGLITYDSYWFQLHNDPTLLSNRDIKEVLERSKTLEDKVKQAFPKPIYKEAAVRIVHGLSVDRLTTPDIQAPIGLTTKEVRDGLLIHVPNLPQKDSDFLDGIIGVILKDIMTTVSGQYIGKNEENGQFFIDVKKAVDYDQNIAERAAMLTDDQKDAAYFDALSKIILENPDSLSYVRGYRIWEYDVLWADHNVDRPGYLFFGAPNERSTAQPPRDFYLYFLQVHKRPDFRDEKKPDEVFFELLDSEDEKFQVPLQRYASATKLAESQSHSKQVYKEKAEQALRELVTWLRDNLPSRARVTWKGQRKLLKEWQSGVPGPKREVRDMVEAVASTCLSGHFEDQYPQYPIFEVRLTRDNRDELCRAAIKQIVGGGGSKAATAILNSLKLLEDGDLRPSASPFSKPVLDALASKKQGQVVNRSELMESISPGQSYEVEKTTRIEADLFAVVLAALCYHGDLVLAFQGEKIDAGNSGALIRKSVLELARFKQVEKPRGIPTGAVMALCRLVGVNENMVKDPNIHETMVLGIQARRSAVLGEVVRWIGWLRAPPTLWGIKIVSEQEATSIIIKLEELKGFLDGLQAIDTPARLVNLKATESEINAYEKSIRLSDKLKAREQIVERLGELVKYVENASLLLPEDDPWHSNIPSFKASLAGLLSSETSTAHDLRILEQNLINLKNNYQEQYLKLHTSMRLGPSDEKRRTALLNSHRLKTLQSLSRINALLNSNGLDQWTEEVSGLKACFSLVQSELEITPQCPNCHLNPSKEMSGESKGILGRLESELEKMEEEWVTTLHTNLSDIMLKEKIDLLDTEQKEIIETFIKSGELPNKDMELFVLAAITVASGLSKVQISMKEVHEALVASGSASKPEAVKERFKQLLEKRTRGINPDKVRVVFIDNEERKE